VEVIYRTEAHSHLRTWISHGEHGAHYRTYTLYNMLDTNSGPKPNGTRNLSLIVQVHDLKTAVDRARSFGGSRSRSLKLQGGYNGEQ